MAADTAKTDGAIGNECLKPKLPAAKVAETPNSLPLQDSTCAAAVCVDIDPSAASCEPTEKPCQKHGVR